MIPEIDDALRTIVREEALQGSDVEVVFDAPTTDWAARRNSPTVNMYLYDLREDPRWRERGFVVERGDDGAVTARRPPNRRFKLSYLVTAWTQRPEDEHRLLDTLLRCFLRYEVLPSLVGDGLALDGTRATVSVGLPPPEDRGFADVWSALGGQLKPSLDLVVNAPVQTGVLLAAGPPVQEGPVIEIGDRDGGAVERRQRRPDRDEDDAGEGEAAAPPPPPPDPAAAGSGRKPRARKPR
ncbi:DUF4255 domain-containing protein [Georgenia faecalis]|uniref:DUF4255 domain-containing protein n=1 Tax=Georgenia faecalis TaxID=2483799 RepID=UPI000FDCD517|nr:DUF4255 domain-containing protein [Georgenia faecalis]